MRYIKILTFWAVLLLSAIAPSIAQSADAEVSERADQQNIKSREKPCAICKPKNISRPYAFNRHSEIKRIYDLNSEVYVLDGVDYTKDRLVKGFLETAYQRHLWQSDTALWAPDLETAKNTDASLLKELFKSQSKPEASLSGMNGYFSGIPTQHLPANMREKHAYDKYISRKDGMPTFDSIHRWRGKKKLRVALCFTAGDCGKLTKKTVSLDVVQEQVPYVSSLTQPVTGIEIMYLPTELDDPEDPAEIRIMFAGNEAFFPDNKFKTSRYVGGLMEASTDSSPVGDNQYFEKYVQGAVRFTPYARAQVEGYLLSDHENNLDFAVCYLWPYHQKEVLASLMNECLLRALGLPEMASVQGAGVLGHWNKTYDRVSKRSVLDGPTVNEWLASVAKTEMGWTRSGEDAAYGRELEKLIAKGNRKDLFTNYPKIVKQRLSEFDLAMLSMLYCADIRPGMGRYEILDAFYKSNNCFAFKGVSKAAK